MVYSAKNETSNRWVHDTYVEAFITYSPKEVTIELFENVDGEGVRSDELLFMNTLF